MSFGNILEQALSIIPKQSFTWYPFGGYTQDSAMQRVNSYQPGIACYGSIQSVEQAMYERLGLDFENNYRLIYSSHDLKGVDNQNAPDMVEFEGRRWKVVRNTPWYNYDGWNGVVVVEDRENVPG